MHIQIAGFSKLKTQFLCLETWFACLKTQFVRASSRDNLVLSRDCQLTFAQYRITIII